MSVERQRIMSELKLELMKYYDKMKRDIAIDFLNALKKQDDRDEEKQKKLLQTYEVITNRLKYSLASNLKKICEFNDDLCLNDDESICKEDLKKKLVDMHCYYVKHNLLLNLSERKKFKDIGYLVITDWYMDQSQLLYLRSKMEKNFWHETDARNLCIDSDFLNLFIRLENFLSRDRCIIYLQKQHLQVKQDAFKEFEINLESFSCIDLKNNLFKNMKNLEKLTIPNINANLRINEYTFNGLLNLTDLNLKFKKIHIHTNAFYNLIQLNYLTITQNFYGKKFKLKPVGFLEDYRIDDLFELSYFGADYDTLKKILNASHSYTNLNSLEIKCSNLILNNESFHNLEHLETLKLHVTNLKVIDDDVFKNLINLKQLNLFFKRIKRITKGLFNGLNGLEYLLIESSRCDENDIPYVHLIIEEDAFDNLANLKELYIDVVALPYLNQRHLNNLTSLTYLCIRAKLIGEIERDICKTLKSLNSIEFRIKDQSEQFESIFSSSDEEVEKYFGIADEALFASIDVCPYSYGGLEMLTTTF